MAITERGSEVSIRTGQIDDAISILDIQRDVITENKYLISEIGECNKTLEKQRIWIQKILDNNRETLIIAEKDEKVIGFIAFESPNRKRLAHTGSFETMIYSDYRGLGIGKMLISELLAWAENNPLIEKVSLGVLSTNNRAISLYKSMGFVEEGRKTKEIKVSENEYADDILMYKFV
ncbi:GNAT family N-acetyltransferase [Metabacillus endolithicus]|uniref:GNAT family N-acetyltransferase n=1 Tax=Metabacillus endolithicus TaxID=1535204 RepID=A0ABW5BTI1_9BACI|nr:GNAT family N-acetyltransferase [Metabacillus endolithicus]UPG63869.1 GNAT family N-acetyltransferase [Metabacillus endolithicus]